ncbi:MAG: response regulator [Anaerolineae bacterium]|nr:response regulator [Anaerolineae bacterium]
MSLPVPEADEPARVLVVDDSPSARQLIVDLINADAGLAVVGEAKNGLEAVRLNRALAPHIIAMDLTLPLMDGLQATALIMQESPNRVVLLQTAARCWPTPT